VNERGSAPAEFVLVSALLVALVLGVVQVALLAHVRHTLTMAAAEGARYAALIDATGPAAIAHTRALIDQSLSPAYSRNIDIARSGELGIPTVRISIVAPFPALGLWSVGGEMRVSAHAPENYVPSR